MISIIVPVYNVEMYIERCLNSIVTQSYTDFEVLLIDDCGGDNSISLADSYIKNNHLDQRVRIIHHNKNRGLSAARNTGILEANGDYIFFLDSDDTISTHCLESLHRYVTDDVDFIMGNYEQAPSSIVPYDFKRSRIINKDELIWEYYNFKLPWNAVNRLIRREFLIDNDLFFKEGILSEDLLWNFMLLPKVRKAVLVNQCTYQYYTNQGSIMHSTRNNIKYLSDLLLIVDRMREIVISENTNNAKLKSYYLKIKYDFIPYAVLWHNYSKEIQLSTFKKLFDSRFVDKSLLSYDRSFIYHSPFFVFIIRTYLTFYSKELYQLLKTKFCHWFKIV